MKEVIANILATALILISGMATAAEITWGKDGVLTAGKFRFELTHYGDGWEKNIAGVRKRSDGTTEFPGVTGPFVLKTKNAAASERFALDLQLSASPALATDDLALEITLPLPRHSGDSILAEGKKIGFGKKYDATNWFIARTLKTLQLTTGDETLEISGPFEIRLQDNRRYSQNNWSLRIYPKPLHRGMISDARWDSVWKLSRLHTVPLNLASAAGMGFADETANDGKGGWTDQGKENDLRMFPVEQREFAGVPFHILDPAENNGKSVIALKGNDRKSFPETRVIRLKQSTRAKYLYLLHALGWEPNRPQETGMVICEYDGAKFTDRNEKTFLLTSGRDVANFWRPRKIENAAIGWQGVNPSAPVGLYVTRLELSGEPLRKITFHSCGNAVWLIAGATLSDQKFGKVEDETRPVVFQANADWMISETSRTRIEPGSVLDFSSLTDAPAGKYGFLRNRNGRFEFEKKPDKPVRFYGINIAFNVNFLDHKLCDRMVDDLIRGGYNLLRLHHFDGLIVDSSRSDAIHLRPEKLDRVNYLIARCGARGVYVTLDLFTIREPVHVKEFPGWDIDLFEYKALVFVSRDVMNDFKEFSRQLLTQVNPYTGKKWTDDPAVALLSLINEDTIFATVRHSKRIAKIYDEKYKEWRQRNGIILTPANQSGNWRRFLSEVYQKGFRELHELCRELGVKVPVTDQNYWTNIGSTLLRNQYDYVDNHFYWAHPTFLGKNWQLPILYNPESSILRYAGGLCEQFSNRIHGKPYTISEWNYNHPNEYKSEGAFLVGAYAALQDWSMLCRFTYTHTPRDLTERPRAVTYLDIANDPVRTLSDVAGMLFFRRGDVSPSEQSYVFLLREDYWNRPENPDNFPPILARLGLIGKVATMIIPPGGSPKLPKGTKAVIGKKDDWGNAFGTLPFLPDTCGIGKGISELCKEHALFPGEINRKISCFRSSTGELTLNRDKASFRVVTPRSEGFILKKNSKAEGRFAVVENRHATGAFLIASHDNKPLAESERILLLHLTNIRNTGERYRDKSLTVLEKWGTTPLLVQRAEAKLTLRRNLEGFRFYALNLDGKRLMELPFDAVARETRLTLKTDRNGIAIMVYELEKDSGLETLESTDPRNPAR